MTGFLSITLQLLKEFEWLAQMNLPNHSQALISVQTLAYNYSFILFTSEPTDEIITVQRSLVSSPVNPPLFSSSSK